MPTLYEAFKKTARYSPKPDIAREPTARLPYALFGPTIATHFPLFAESQEDDAFKARVKTFHEFLATHRIARQFNLTRIHEDNILNAFDQARNKKHAYPSSKNIKAAIKFVWSASRKQLRISAEKRPEIFIFNARTLLALDINRRAHDLVVEAIVRSRSPWDDPDLVSNAFDITDAVLNKIIAEVDDVLTKFQAERPLILTTRDATATTPRLGGIISWFSAHNKISNNIHESEFSDRRLIALESPHLNDDSAKLEPTIDRYLLWRREDRSWRYTFYEGIYRYPYSDCVDQFERFIERLLSSRTLEFSFPEKEFDDLDPNINYLFPGTRIAGAQYFVIPPEILVLVLKNLTQLTKLLSILDKTKISIKTEIIFRSANGYTVDTALQALYDLDEAVLGGRDFFTKIIEDYVETKTFNIEKALYSAAEMRTRLRLLYDKINADKSSATPGKVGRLELFFQIFVALAELLWKHLYTSDDYRMGQDDFVSSSVIDGRAIYFSNFRPYETEGKNSSKRARARNDYNSDVGFTRTFFIDFSLVPYQRGRLVRRLCDIASYRMSCMKDLDRLHAIQDNINQLNSEFSKLISESELTSSKDIVAISDALDRALLLYRCALQLDMFVTEGISGKRRAALADWAQVKKQVDDIREDRVAGYAQLSDFLERGLAVAILELDRIADRYEGLIGRVSNHLSTIRTEMSGANIHNITYLMENYRLLLEKSGAQSDIQTNILKETERHSKTHTSLLNAAELLVWLGGTYYLKTLLEPVTPDFFSREILNEILLALFSLTVVGIFVYWLKDKLRDLLDRAKKRVRKWTAASPRPERDSE